MKAENILNFQISREIQFSVHKPEHFSCARAVISGTSFVFCIFMRISVVVALYFMYLTEHDRREHHHWNRTDWSRRSICSLRRYSLLHRQGKAYVAEYRKAKEEYYYRM